MVLAGFYLCEAETLGQGRSLLPTDCLPATQHHQSAEQWSLCSQRILEWFGLQGTFKGHLLQVPCNDQEHFQLEQVAQIPVRLECVVSTVSLENLWQCFTTLFVNNLSLYLV